MNVPSTTMPHDDKLAHYNRSDHIVISDADRNSSAAASYPSDDDTDDDNEDDDDLAERIDRLMAATMEALEASNALVLDTLASRAKLAQLNAMEAALDSHLDTREAHLRRQITAVSDMSDFMARTTAELDKLTRLGQASRRSSVDHSSANPITALADAAGLQVRGAAAAGIVQAQDRDATIGKTAAKRLERMLHAPTTPSASPSSPPLPSVAIPILRDARSRYPTLLLCSRALPKNRRSNIKSPPASSLPQRRLRPNWPRTRPLTAAMAHHRRSVRSATTAEPPQAST